MIWFLKIFAFALTFFAVCGGALVAMEHNIDHDSKWPFLFIPLWLSVWIAILVLILTRGWFQP